MDEKGKPQLPFSLYGAGEESRTLDLNLGKVALYQLSYSRIAHQGFRLQRRTHKYSGNQCVVTSPGTAATAVVATGSTTFTGSSSGSGRGADSSACWST